MNDFFKEACDEQLTSAAPVDWSISSAYLVLPLIWVSSCAKSYDTDLIHRITLILAEELL